LKPPARTHWVYIVRCADGTLYTGYARDPERRVQAHNAGRGAKYTSGRKPVCLVYAESFRSRRAALRREIVVKALTRARKESLIGARPSTEEAAQRRGIIPPRSDQLSNPVQPALRRRQ
jgi:putative endonuclease